MDEEIAKLAVENVMEVYSRDDFDYIARLCLDSIKAYELSLYKAGLKIVSTTDQSGAAARTPQKAD